MKLWKCYLLVLLLVLFKSIVKTTQVSFIYVYLMKTTQGYMLMLYENYAAIFIS